MTLHGTTLRVAALAVALVAPPPVAAADGDLDPTFHGDGRYQTEFGLWGDFEIADVLEAPDGRLVVSGLNRPEGSAPPRFFWQALGDGAATTDDRCELVPLGGGTDVSGGAAAFDGQGRLLIAGGAVYGGSRRIAVARYLYPACELDDAFDGDGYATFDLLAGEEFVEDVAVERHGRILLAGAGVSAGQYDALVVRLLGSGALDSSFNFVGWIQVDVYTEAADDLATAIGTFPGVGPLPDPTWVVGYAEDPDTQPGGGPGTAGFVLKFDPAGAPDPDFGTLPQTGVVRIEYARWDYLLSGAFDPRGDRLLVTGWGLANSPPVGQTGGTLTALDPQYGFFSSTLDGDGRMYFLPFREPEAVAVDGLGRILLAGTNRSTAPEYDFLVYRLLPDGAFDPTFSGDGQLFVDFGADPDDHDFGRAVALLPGGVAVAGAAESSLGDPVVGAARLKSALLFADGFEAGTLSAW
jgi:uncharacterized delta-60 repeat protein